MAKLPTTPQGRRIPGYCLHKPSGRAYVRINGKHLPLGDYDPSEGSESMQLYRRLIGEWRSNGFRTPSVEPASGGARGGGAPAMTLRELTAWFLEWAEANYSRSEFLLCRQGLRAACKLYGRSSVADIGVAELRAVRQSLLERSGEEGVAPRKPLGRKTVNALIGRVQRAFAYGASEGQIPPEAAAAVGALKPLKRGRTEALDYPLREPAEWKGVEKVLPLLSPQVRAIILTLWYSGARIGEVCLLRSSDVEMRGKVWVFSPSRHKTAHHGLARAVMLGPKAQGVLRPFVKEDPQQYWFNAADESAWRKELWDSMSAEERKKSGVRCSRPGAVVRQGLDPRAVERQLREACKKAGVKFTTHQLRHAALTRIRDDQGIESARLIAGQHSDVVTRGYTHTIEKKKAAEVARRLG